MEQEYRTVHDLTLDELEELRGSLYQQYLDDGLIDVDTFDGVTDEMLFEYYDGVSFVRDDFFCNMI